MSVAIRVDRGQEEAVIAEAIWRAGQTQHQREQSQVAVLPSDVEGWFKDTLGSHLYRKQVEMAEALRDASQVSCSGANGLGKDYAAARLALWWIEYCRPEPAKVIITGPTYRQVHQIVWQETRQAWLNAPRQAAIGGTLYQNPLLRWSEDRFILGFSTEKGYGLQGFHSENLMVIVTEAHAVGQQHFDALYRLNPKKILLTGNPLTEDGEFFESHHGHSHLWRTVNIRAQDSPRVTGEGEPGDWPGLVGPEDIERIRQRYGEDSPLYKMQIGNEWVEGLASQVVVPLSWVVKAETAEFAQVGVEVLGVDVARQGRDSTVIYARKGRVARLIWKAQGQDTMQTADQVAAYVKARPWTHVVVDGVGIGAGVVDRLRQLGIGCVDFQSGAAASDSGQYANRIAEVYWRMREAFSTGMDIDAQPDLRAQLSSRKYEIQGDRRIRLESKDDIAASGRQGPDEGDALALTFAQDWRLDGSSTSPDSDAPDRSAEHDLTEGKQAGYRPSLAAITRGSEFAPYRASRWGPIRRR